MSRRGCALLTLALSCSLPELAGAVHLQIGRDPANEQSCPRGCPELEPVTVEHGRYTAGSVRGAVMNASEDQFWYNMADNGYVNGIEFPSAWLLKRSRLLENQQPSSWGATNIEANVFMPVGYGDIYGNKVQKTIDFFNFLGVHLSFWADFARLRGAAPAPDSPAAKVREYFGDRLSNDIARFRQQASTAERTALREKTVALLPFAMSKDREGAKTAMIMLNATFWSLKSQFDAVVLGACHPDDHRFLTEFPAWRVVRLSGNFCQTNGGMYLIEHAMNAMRGEAADSKEWEQFDYVYYTEGDIVLYLREHDRIQARLEQHGALIPHRVDTFPAMDDFPEGLRAAVTGDGGYHAAIAGTSTPVARVELDSASCCFSGRVRSASDFWWITAGMGEQNTFKLLESVKFADDGLPITLASHGGPEVCKVSARGACR